MSDAIEKKVAGGPVAKGLRYGGILMLAAAPIVATGEGFGGRFAAAVAAGAVTFAVGAFLGRPRAR